MGCVSSSSTRVSPTRQPRQPINFSDFDDDGNIVIDPVFVPVPDFLSQNFASILSGISRVPLADGFCRPVVCVSCNVSPLVSSELRLSNGDATNVELPVAAFGVFGQGRVVCLAGISILAKCTSGNTEANAFLENITRYCSEMRAIYRVVILGVPERHANQIKENLKVFEFAAEITEAKDDLSKCGCVICTNKCRAGYMLEQFLKDGGGIIVGFDDGDQPQDQEFDPILQGLLLDIGFGFPQCSLTLGDKSTDRYRSDRTFEQMSRLSFQNLAEKLLALMEVIDEKDMLEYDSLVTTLRYYIISLKRGENEILKELFIKSWELLDKTEAIGENSVCPQLIHGITYVLISELLAKVPAKYFEGMDRSLPFPGQIGFDVEIADFKTSADFHCESWVSTGLYLPPGVVATATLQNIVPNISIQIGSHTRCILSKLGPWRRWAIVTTTFDFDQETIEISSPFGGIIYIVCNNVDSELDIQLSVTFQQVTRHPSYIVHTSDDFQMFDVPFGEIETQFVIFTLPSKYLAEYQDILGSFCEFIDSIISKVLTFTSDQSTRLFRVVFDVELLEDIISTYPIFLSIDLIRGIIGSNSNPTPELFILLTTIALSSMPENVFDRTIMESFAMIAALNAFHETWPDTDPLQFIVNQPPELFNAMYKVYEIHSSSCFIKAFAKVRASLDILQSVRPDSWTLFLKKIALETKDKSYRLLTKIKQTNVNMNAMIMTNSSSSLSEYQLTDAAAANSIIV